jgi:hypothetical protein
MPDDPSQRPEDVQFLSGVILVCWTVGVMSP